MAVGCGDSMSVSFRNAYVRVVIGCIRTPMRVLLLGVSTSAGLIPDPLLRNILCYMTIILLACFYDL